MSLKRCKNCGLEKPATTEHFPPYRAKGGPGLRGQCRDCWNAVMRDTVKSWRNRNPDRWEGILAAYADTAAAGHRAWVAANPERRRAIALAYYYRHYNKARAMSEAWAKAHPERRAEMAQRRKARKLATMVELIDYSAILDRYGRWCHICQQPIEGRLEFDHVVPLALGGTHTADNIKPAHPFCNRSKGAWPHRMEKLQIKT